MVAKICLFIIALELLVFIPIDVDCVSTAEDIFSNDRILTVVLKSGVFNDLKSFVDMKLKYPPEKVGKEFDTMMTTASGKPSLNVVRRFVRRNFAPSGSELERQTPSDWVSNPSFLNSITDTSLKEWAQTLHGMWRRLYRVVNKDVQLKPYLYSTIYVPNPVIVPGGRYREFYYWDSYWIVLGLLHSEMFDTAKGIIENFLLLVEEFGFVPNAGRIYYIGRTNVPMLIPMVELYCNMTQNTNFIKKNIKTLEKEFRFWMDKRVVTVKANGSTYKLARYFGKSTVPRPDDYAKDVERIKALSSGKDLDMLDSEMGSICESGWDYSSRWFTSTKRGANPYRTKITKIIPVDLNAILYFNANKLSEFYKKIKNEKKETEFKKIADEWKSSIRSVLWNEEDGIWYDYDYEIGKPRKQFFASNLTPLWAGCYDDMENSKSVVSAVLEYLQQENVLGYEGCVPASNIRSTEKWDFPNCFPPCQHFIVQGLLNTNNEEAQELALHIAFKWIRTNFRAYSFTKLIYARYDARFGGIGEASQYVSDEVGYGWTLGVCIDFLYKYGNLLNSDFSNIGDRPYPSFYLPELTLTILILFL